MRGQELLTYVVYDIVSDRIRLKIAGVCKDYGLDHIQYSVFSGPLDATRRREIFSPAGRHPGRQRRAHPDVADVREGRRRPAAKSRAGRVPRTARSGVRKKVKSRFRAMHCDQHR